MTEVAKIPVIDIAAGGEEQSKVAKELVEAAIEHGFIYIKNTGQDIPLQAVESAFNIVLAQQSPTAPCAAPTDTNNLEQDAVWCSSG